MTQTARSSTKYVPKRSAAVKCTPPSTCRGTDNAAQREQHTLAGQGWLGRCPAACGHGPAGQVCSAPRAALHALVRGGVASQAQHAPVKRSHRSTGKQCWRFTAAGGGDADSLVPIVVAAVFVRQRARLCGRRTNARHTRVSGVRGRCPAETSRYRCGLRGGNAATPHGRDRGCRRRAA